MAVETDNSLFGCFPVVMIAALFGLFAWLGVRQDVAPVQSAPAQPEQAQTGGTIEGVESLTIIEKIETQVSASMPATITLQISGYHPDGCQFPVQVQQTWDGNRVTVKIFRIMPPDIMCTMQLNPYIDSITLDDTFDSGAYTIDVNGTLVEIKV